ncbi:hypothetical protein B7P43_G15531 [Cryptotermes secundus]|uniref:PiggyBac transposable element-derived protein domain-containing protein n=1 Tax=Cryptotermes secundus TaxID=105785 RepID=A0A2J7RJ75_9NEOP|nr:hypothetical protein B7P43_G15531 [Cryptotermes secundus]
MEPQKRAQYSKLLNAEELDEILMKKESDDELEELNEFIEPRENRRPEDSPKLLDFTGPLSGINRSAAPNINLQSSPFSIFILFFQQIFQILLQETNRYFHQFMACQDAPGPSVQLPDVTIEEMYKFLAIIIQMGHDQWDTL